MTKEELEKEAEEYAYNNYEILVDTSNAFVTSEDYLEQGYFAGAEPRENRIADLEKEKCELLGIIQGKDTAIQDLQKKNKILTKALNLYINWADECGIAWDNFPDEKEKWLKTVEEKGLGWIEGLTFMVMEEAKEQLQKEEQND